MALILTFVSCSDDDSSDLSLNIENMDFNADGSPIGLNTLIIDVKEPFGIKCDADWVVCQQADVPTGINVYDVNVFSNSSTEPRLATIIITLVSGEQSKTVTVTQAGKTE